MNSYLLRCIMQNFCIGGACVATTSYLGTFFSPLAGAIFWAYPITLIPSIFFMKQQNRSKKFISKFLFSTTFALILLMGITFLLSYTISNSSEDESLWVAIGTSTIGFILGAITYYLIIKALHLEKYFI